MRPWLGCATPRLCVRARPSPPPDATAYAFPSSSSRRVRQLVAEEEVAVPVTSESNLMRSRISGDYARDQRAVHGTRDARREILLQLRSEPLDEVRRSEASRGCRHRSSTSSFSTLNTAGFFTMRSSEKCSMNWFLRQDLRLVIQRPADQREEVEQRFRQIPLVAVLEHARRAVPLAQFARRPDRGFAACAPAPAARCRARDR